MNRLVLLFAGSLVFASLTACNPRYCAGNPDDDCRKTWDAGPKLCKGNSDCMAPNGVCDLEATMMCVQCTTSQPGACSGVTPLCISNQCQRCTAHAQCTASNVCLPDGSCADAQQVAYVRDGSSGNTCTLASPCGTIDAALARKKPFVKIATGTITTNNTTVIDGQAVAILADPGVQIRRSNGGVILQVQNDGADVQIFDVEITGGTGPANAAVSIPNGGAPKLGLTRVAIDGNQGLGVSVAAGTLTVSESTISNNQGLGLSVTAGMLTVSRSTISSNSGGGISVTGATSIFDISESFIVHNGHATNQPSIVGGAALSTAAAGSRFEWNTVAFNESDGSLFRGGVSCTGALPTAAGNLIYHNTEPDGSGGTKTDATTQKNTGGCQYGNTLAVATDAGNLGFKSPLVMPYDFHLTSTTPATIIDAGGMCSGQDFDGQSRPIGPACDLGADEYPTP